MTVINAIKKFNRLTALDSVYIYLSIYPSILILTGHFIRYTCSIAWQHKLLISQSHGSNSMHLSFYMWWRRLAEIQTEHQNGEERGFKWLWTWNGCLVPDGLVWVFQKLLIYWDFHAQPSLGFTENGLKKRKYPVSGSCVDENALLMSEENGQTG